MSWNLKDSLGHRSRDGTAPVSTPPPSATWNDAAPLPTVAAALAWDQGHGQRSLSRLEEEALMAEGIIPDSDMAYWRQIMTRGIPAL